MTTEAALENVSETRDIAPIGLDDKYLRLTGRIFVSGAQALVRIPIDQARRDAAKGLDTAGFVSGYRGSPLGMYDMALWQADKHLKAHSILFQPGVNEELAATAINGTQEAPFLPGARHQGVFSIWYGKGPGVDRSGDAMKHGNLAGAHRFGGVLALCGDDHAARSSTTAHQSDQAMIHYGMPLLNPANIQEVLDYGLLGLEMSRYSGAWVGMKCLADTIDGTASIEVDPARNVPVIPTDYPMPEGGVGNPGKWVPMLQAEKRLFEERLPAAQAFARANNLDGVRFGADGRCRLGIVTSGKSFLDVLEAFASLGITEQDARRQGIAIYKVGMVYPLEPVRMRRFATACEEVLVIEEKRGVIEPQLVQTLYNLPDTERPRMIGKTDAAGQPFISSVGELTSAGITTIIAKRIGAVFGEEEMRRRLMPHDNIGKVGATASVSPVVRAPTFCAGCPHSTSTRVPDGSIALSGIGCHGMAAFFPERKVFSSSQMGGEGAAWIGQAPFTDMPHIFQNLGDGTYFHSGIIALRACVAAGVPITYKILLNGAIGMTGGQPIEGEEFAGELTAPHVANQVRAEGVERIAVVSDHIEKYGDRAAFPRGTSFHHRDDLDTVQRELREINGVSVIIYDQPCATERRRLRKRGKVAPSTTRLYIDPDVCEGCGDCGVQSNCIALEPLETDSGRKRRINQSVCNQDLSCLKGFCPSFVTLEGAKPRSRAADLSKLGDITSRLSEPERPDVGDTFSVLVTGIGGNGVVTVGAILGMAAHLEGRLATVLDMSGFAQRNGAVLSHVRITGKAQQEHSARIPERGLDLLIGCDAIVTGNADSIRMMEPGNTRVLVNDFVAPTSGFAADPDMRMDFSRFAQVIAERVGEENLYRVNATDAAMALVGDAIGANMFLVGHAWQRGLLPLSRQSLEAAITTNGAAVGMNRAAFDLGRMAAADPDGFARLTGNAKPKVSTLTPATLDEVVTTRAAHLTAYQDERLARRYRAFIDRVVAAEKAAGTDGLAIVVARVLAKLLAYKDEYEVARLFSRPSFQKGLSEQFEGDYRIAFNLAPPFLSRRNPATGRLVKRSYGPMMLKAFRLLARLKGLRGTVFDPFGRHSHRKLERALADEYETLVERLMTTLRPDNAADHIAIAAIYDGIRGYDVVKEEAIERARAAVADALKKQAPPA